jgi:SagB-type dehydrogenase family enzyme
VAVTSKKRIILYRRCPHLVIYWAGDELVFTRYAPLSNQVTAAAITCEILDLFSHWRPPEVLFRHMPQYSRSSLEKALTLLVENGLLQRSNSPREPRSTMQSWDLWNPAAGLFHFSTKDVEFDTDLEAGFHDLSQRAKAHPPPAPVKHYRRARKFNLPAPASEGEFPRVLLERRTWRNFSSSALSQSDLGTLMGLTWRVQRWLKAPGIGRYALKTSPSGGALHPIEAYVLSLRVTGLPRGLYHYAADTHQLELLRKGASAVQAEAYLAQQWWFGSAAALVLMTAVFPRSQWKYECPRAYRVVLAEAGHFCQTFCLVATWLKLAPFCTMALADSRIEQALGIDGVNESILYAAGVGAVPANGEWSPLPRPR